MNKLQPVICTDALRYLSHALFNRTLTHRLLSPPTKMLSRTKEKVGANPPDNTAALQASEELYEKGGREASEQEAQGPQSSGLKAFFARPARQPLAAGLLRAVSSAFQRITR
jgi:hypothetical protein